MKKFYLLKLQYRGNKVIGEYKAMTLKDAVRYFNSMYQLFAGLDVPNVPIDLDEYGYRKSDPLLGESVTYTVAEGLWTPA